MYNTPCWRITLSFLSKEKKVNISADIVFGVLIVSKIIFDALSPLKVKSLKGRVNVSSLKLTLFTFVLAEAMKNVKTCFCLSFNLPGYSGTSHYPPSYYTRTIQIKTVTEMQIFFFSVFLFV